MADAFSQLLEWRRTEASARTLAKIGPEFYGGTARYLADLRRSYEADLRENPSGRKGEISRQTYQRAGQVARDILEARGQKILSAVFQASVGGSRDLPNALPEEQALYDQLLETLLRFRRASAPYLEPSGVAPPAPVPTSTPAPVAAPPAPRHESPAAAASAPSAPPATAYVRVLRSTRPLELGSETVDLREDDILSLPVEAAKILIAGKVAEALTVPPIPRPR